MLQKGHFVLRMSLQMSHQTLSCQGITVSPEQKQITYQLTNLKHSTHDISICVCLLMVIIIIDIMFAMFSRCLYTLVIEPSTPPLSVAGIFFCWCFFYWTTWGVSLHMHAFLCMCALTCKTFLFQAWKILYASTRTQTFLCEHDFVLLDTLQFIMKLMYALHSNVLYRKSIGLLSIVLRGLLLPSNIILYDWKSCTWDLCTCV